MDLAPCHFLLDTTFLVKETENLTSNHMKKVVLLAYRMMGYPFRVEKQGERVDGKKDSYSREIRVGV